MSLDKDVMTAEKQSGAVGVGRDTQQTSQKPYSTREKKAKNII